MKTVIGIFLILTGELVFAQEPPVQAKTQEETPTFVEIVDTPTTTVPDKSHDVTAEVLAPSQMNTASNASNTQRTPASVNASGVAVATPSATPQVVPKMPEMSTAAKAMTEEMLKDSDSKISQAKAVIQTIEGNDVFGGEDFKAWREDLKTMINARQKYLSEDRAHYYANPGVEPRDLASNERKLFFAKLADRANIKDSGMKNDLERLIVSLLLDRAYLSSSAPAVAAAQDAMRTVTSTTDSTPGAPTTLPTNSSLSVTAPAAPIAQPLTNSAVQGSNR